MTPQPDDPHEGAPKQRRRPRWRVETASIYVVLLAIAGVSALSVALGALAAPIWLILPVSLVLGVATAKAGIWLSWRREGERLTWTR